MLHSTYIDKFVYFAAFRSRAKKTVTRVQKSVQGRKIMRTKMFDRRIICFCLHDVHVSANAHDVADARHRRIRR
jgi:hypothetical protein